MKKRSANAKKMRSERQAPKKTSSAHRYYLVAEFSAEEKQAIQQYCQTHNLSISRFLAQVALDDASAKKAEPEEPLTVTINLPASKRAKLLYLARLKEKSIDQLIEEFIAPTLGKNKRGPGASYTLATERVPLYLNAQEHALLMKHMEKQGVSSRHYFAQLAVQAIEKRSASRKSKR
jgi:hypothetical protein